MTCGPLPNHVTVADCWARDGLQHEIEFVPTSAKVAVINSLVEAGVQQVEIASFTPAAVAPQFSDVIDVLEQINRTDRLMVRCLIPNMRGLERAIACTQAGAGVDAIGFPFSASEAHNKSNLNRSHEEHMPELEKITSRAKTEGFQVVASVSTAFGCPFVGDVPREKVLELVRFLRDIGVDWMMLGDTTGMANPMDAFELYAGAIELAPDVQWIGHFHDSRGAGLANCLAAMAAGVRCFDASLGGIGGQAAGQSHRYHTGDQGNVSTEDLVHVLTEMGIETGIDVDKLLSAGRLAERAIGRTVRSHVLATGPVSGPRARKLQGQRA